MEKLSKSTEKLLKSMENQLEDKNTIIGIYKKDIEN